MTMMAAAARKMVRSRSLGCGSPRGHHRRAGREAGWKTDHEVPRVVVDHESEGVDEGAANQPCVTAERMAECRRVIRGTTTRDHHLDDRDGTLCAVGCCVVPTRSMSTRPQDGQVSDAHGIREWQNGHGRKPVGMSRLVPFV
jgi:hypothetical protein